MISCVQSDRCSPRWGKVNGKLQLYSEQRFSWQVYVNSLLKTHGWSEALCIPALKKGAISSRQTIQQVVWEPHQAFVNCYFRVLNRCNSACGRYDRWHPLSLIEFSAQYGIKKKYPRDTLVHRVLLNWSRMRFHFQWDQFEKEVEHLFDCTLKAIVRGERQESVQTKNKEFPLEKLIKKVDTLSESKHLIVQCNEKSVLLCRKSRKILVLNPLPSHYDRFPVSFPIGASLRVFGRSCSKESFRIFCFKFFKADSNTEFHVTAIDHTLNRLASASR